MDREEGVHTEDGNKGKVWHSRGYLPHYDLPGLFQLITFRLHDSLPAVKLAELNHVQHKLSPAQIRNALEDYLDAGAGACYLRNPGVAQVVQRSLLYFDNERYHLCAWVIMPNHVHVLAQFLAQYSVAKVVQSWKRFSARQGNVVLGRSGEFWQREYYDRYIRSEQHFSNAVKYIEWNPVKAQLVQTPAQWPYCSAHFHEREFG
jgi:REP element-mobilizing transposase RayT